MSNSTVATAPLERIKPLIISAPFGNYIKPRGATPTLGTFTAERRPGRLKQVLKTVRYHPRLRAWTNRIGLRNPGIAWLEQRVKQGKVRVADAIISIHGFDADQWRELLDRAATLRPIALELNLSCPNVGELSWPPDLFTRAISATSSHGVGLIAKLPPLRYEDMVNAALAAGIRGFHCCNTIPVPAGGMSGKPLLPKSLACIQQLQAMAQAAGLERGLFIIGGGGITSTGDIDTYARAGVQRVAIGTKAMNPLRLWWDGPLGRLARHAEQALAKPDGAR
ncbi:MAG: hypothetical protein KDA20_07395 [Phycisphaerales bacterium]|nr:hypothetical protein [Phycisphaerales bacterium]